VSKLCKQPAAQDAEVQWRRLPILDCLPRGNLTALTAGILGSLYQIIQRLLCLHKIRFKDSRQVDTSEASGSEPLTQEKDCS